MKKEQEGWDWYYVIKGKSLTVLTLRALQPPSAVPAVLLTQQFLEFDIEPLE